MIDRWDDSDAQAQFEREQQIWIAKEQYRRSSQSSLLWGAAVVAILLIAVVASLH